MNNDDLSEYIKSIFMKARGGARRSEDIMREIFTDLAGEAGLATCEDMSRIMNDIEGLRSRIQHLESCGGRK